MASNHAASANVDLLFNGKEVPDGHIQELSVERDMFQPDMATIVLMNQGDIYSKQKIGDACEIKVGENAVSIFKGDIVGLEPIYKGGEKTTILIRCMNQLHRLLRIRKSRTWTDKTDQQVLSAVVGDAGLSLEFKHDKAIQYKHIYQHNQTDLEFIRTRAARLGCHVWCVDKKVYVKQPDFGQSTGVELKVDTSNDKADAQLLAFMPRLSSASVVKKVTVRGWSAEKKELIEGSATAAGSQLGKQHASAASNTLGKEETFIADHPITSKEEADALAKARLTDLCLTFITGEAKMKDSNPKLELGKTLKMTANSETQDDPFNGGYYIMGLTYRQKMKAKADGAYTLIKLARDAQGPA